MDLIITPAKLCGTFKAVPSEEEALRLLVCGALSKPSSVVKGVGMTENVNRLINALKIMGAQLSVRDDRIRFADMVIKDSITVAAAPIRLWRIRFLLLLHTVLMPRSAAIRLLPTISLRSSYPACAVMESRLISAAKCLLG